MRNLREIEGRIVTELRDLRGLESKLDQRFAGLSAASSKARLSFLAGLMDLEERARGLEKLVDALNEDNQTAHDTAVQLRKETNNAANTAIDLAGYYADRRPSHMAV
jgi:hypothetical protein